MTPEEACADKKFCCTLINGEMHLKHRDAFYYQIQGQMMVTGHKWCDFVFWTNNTSTANSTHTSTIGYAKGFVQKLLQPGLLYFSEHALFPELVTGRIK